eukprot:jgi/Chlat1/1053/Chrsp110S01561
MVAAAAAAAAGVVALRAGSRAWQQGVASAGVPGGSGRGLQAAEAGLQLLRQGFSSNTSTRPAVAAVGFCLTGPHRSTRPRNQRMAPAFCTAAAADSGATTAAPAAEAAGQASDANIGALDIRVGRIIKAWKHPDADGLYVEEVEVGEDEPRTIVSGLVKYVPVEEMQDRKVVVLCNLKPRNMRGVKSNGMLMAASDAAHENVELLNPPADAPVGERIGFGDQALEAAWPPNKVQKQKAWEKELRTSADKVAFFKDLPFTTSAGPVTVTRIADGNIS